MFIRFIWLFPLLMISLFMGVPVRAQSSPLSAVSNLKLPTGNATDLSRIITLLKNPTASRELAQNLEALQELQAQTVTQNAVQAQILPFWQDLSRHLSAGVSTASGMVQKNWLTLKSDCLALPADLLAMAMYGSNRICQQPAFAWGTGIVGVLTVLSGLFSIGVSIRMRRKKTGRQGAFSRLYLIWSLPFLPVMAASLGSLLWGWITFRTIGHLLIGVGIWWGFALHYFAHQWLMTRRISASARTKAQITGWVNRFSVFTAVMLTGLTGASLLHKAALLHTLSQLMYLGWLVLLVVLVATLKASVQQLLELTPKPDDSPAWQRIKALVNATSGYSYLIILGYLGVVGSAVVLDNQALCWTLLTIGLKTAGIGISTALALYVWHRLYHRVFLSAKSETELSTAVVRSLLWLKHTGNGILVLIALGSVLQVWGIPVLAGVSRYPTLCWLTVKIALVCLVALMISQLSGVIARRILEQASRNFASFQVHPLEAEKRLSTLQSVTQKSVSASVWVMAGLFVLNTLSIDIRPLLGGVGIMGLAVGFGAQSLVKDVIAGLTMIMDNRIRVGDVITLNSVSGTVEQINLRNTVLRALDGTVHVFPNGSIATLANHTFEFAFYVMDLNVAYSHNLQEIIDTVRDLDAALREDPDFHTAILEPVEILGVDRLTDAGIVLRFRMKTVPAQQWRVGREMNRRISQRYKDLGLDYPVPERRMVVDTRDNPVRIKLEGNAGLAFAPETRHLTPPEPL